MAAGFKVVTDTPHLVWKSVVDSDTMYVGQIVRVLTEGVIPLGTASGAYDTTQKYLPYGIVVGLNAVDPSFDTTYKTIKATDASPHGSTTKYILAEGSQSARGDRKLMAQIALILPNTIIKGRIFNAAYGTAPTVGTATAGNTDGLAITGNALEIEGVATLGTIYFRTGSNAGCYRITDDASTTAITWDKPTVADTVIGDTYVRVNLRSEGLSRCQFDAESMFINSAAALTADYFGIVVTSLDLSKAGEEVVEFYFTSEHFAPARA